MTPPRPATSLFACAALAGTLLTLHTTGVMPLELRQGTALTGCGSPVAFRKTAHLPDREDLTPGLRLRRDRTVRDLPRGSVVDLAVELAPGVADYPAMILVGVRASRDLVVESMDGRAFAVPLADVSEITSLSRKGQAANAPMAGTLAGAGLGVGTSMFLGRDDSSGCTTKLAALLLVPTGALIGGAIGAGHRYFANVDVTYHLRGRSAWTVVPVAPAGTAMPDAATPDTAAPTPAPYTVPTDVTPTGAAP